jgi:hypothetical protein
MGYRERAHTEHRAAVRKNRNHRDDRARSPKGSELVGQTRGREQPRLRRRFGLSREKEAAPPDLAGQMLIGYSIAKVL